ncbi:MAG: glycoside hydrolase family 32 protein [Clostridia bacterium]|nr:glycoside hydrolase family 32 protein [Clostridia bacterium]
MKSKYIKVTLLAVIAAFCCVFAFIIPVLSARADGVTLEGEGDNFLYSETSYGKTEKFVYTATANFESGNAAGLVFGADENAKWVFNVDRAENRVKLMHFSENGVDVLRDAWFIGNDKMTDGEKSLVNPKVATARWVQLKVIITPQGDNVYAEFYADNIRRFAFDEKGDDLTIDLNNLREGLTYEGGKTGFNCFSAKVVFDDIYTGVSDYSYYTELYRQQYHFSQFAHWNNDPNGLVYYNGYYHLYYQTYPYTHENGAEGWGNMYWGHARSTDLVHWEHLPVALFPDTEADGWGGGDGFMWSGSAMVFRPEMSEKIDGMNWFPNGNGTGLIAFYTRDGAMQDQVIMSSDDGGITWTKRKTIPQSLTGINKKVSCRDPKVFPVEKSGDTVTLWGMAVTGQETNQVWFFKSDNLWDWSYAGEFEAFRPECPDVITLTADDGNTYTVMTFTGRQYLVGTISYDGGSGNIVYSDLNGNSFSDMKTEDIPFQTMDYGPDSYATQSYYIDDGENNGKTIALSWFSGVPDAPASINAGALGAVRKGWNGGGMTIPVEYGLESVGDGYVLTQTPIVKTSADFDKTAVYSGVDVQITPSGENVLADVNTHCFELEAEIKNPEETPVYFRINMNGDEYTEIGWNAEEGYYVSREHTGDAGLNLGNYRSRHTSGAVDGKNLSFYILSDNGGIEVYCDGFKIPFYVLTFSSPYATKAQFIAESTVTASIEVNEISSVWRGEAQEGETVIYLETQNLELDKALTPAKEVLVYSTTQAELDWAVESGEDVVSVEKTEHGARFTALNAGSAVVTVTCGDIVKKINVSVYSGTVDSDLSFNTDGKVSGNWFVTKDGLLGVQSAGDGFILSENSADNFTYSANFSLSGAAAAIVFRATADMSDYLIANYDDNGKIVKLWSPRGEIGRASATDVDISNITLKVKAKDNNVCVYLNGAELINVTLAETEPTEGLFGLNTCAARTTFKSIVLLTESYTYSGGNLSVKGDTVQAVNALYNRTLGNVKVNPSFYTVVGRAVEISQTYFETLKVEGVYDFTVAGAKASFDFSVNVTMIPLTVINGVTIEKGCNAVIYIGNVTVDAVTLNGTKLTDGYTVENGMLTIDGNKFSVGENAVKINDADITITVTPQATQDLKPDGGNTALIVSLSVVGGVLVLGGAAAVTTVLLLRRKKKNGGNN